MLIRDRKITMVTAVLILLHLAGFGWAEDSQRSVSRNEINLESILKLNDSDDVRFSFVVLGDSRSYPERFKKIARLINSLNPDFVIHLGDIAVNGKVTEFETAIEIIDSIKAPLIAVAGNHDISKTKPVKKNFLRFFGECEITFEINRIRFILVDNSYGYLKNSQIKRIESDLPFNGVRMIFMHAPPAGPYPEHNFEGGADKLVNAIMESGCEYAFFSHIHGYDFRMIGDKCNAFISGGGGAELSGRGIAREIHHVLHVTVEGRKIDVRMIPLRKEDSE